MGKNDCRRIPIRFSYDNPEHMRILDTLDDLNLDVHKSKSHFIMNAIAFYIDAIESGNLTNAAVKEQKEKQQEFVTKDELDDRIARISDSIKTELYQDVVKFLGGMMLTPLANRSEFPPAMQRGVSADKAIEPESEEDDVSTGEDISKTLVQYDNVLSQVMSWSEDE